jgi:predicted alpha/beta superfamily hydrolase
MNISAMSYKRHIGKFPFILLSVFFLLSGHQILSQERQPVYPPVPIPNTEMREFHSFILDRDMEIYIKLPASYISDSDKRYPAWYFTDANRSFPSIANITSIFELPVPSMQEIVVVGIGYKIRDMYDWALFRTYDLTPESIPSVNEYWSKLLKQISGRDFNVRTGGSDIFISFLEKELFPFIEENYRINTSDRCLGGYSYGGLFSLYVMLTRPGLFTKYFAGSPSISFGNGFLYELENRYATTHSDLDVKICLTAGGSEDSVMLANVNRMAERLRSRNYKGLSLEAYVFPMETHQSCMAAALMRGYLVLNKK